jgi:two-component system OmpR family sensor kinase
MLAEGARGRWDWAQRQSGWLEVAWVVFALANLVAMWLLPAWETVPFHFIWISLTVVYGFRVWDMERTGWVLTAVVVTTGVLLLHEVSESFQPPDELTEVPLMAAVFLAMVWHARRRVVAMEGERASLEANRRLLEGQRRFVQDASHELRTPITIAMGHADLLAREIRDPELAEDASIVVDELLRLRRLADRLLLLASSADPDFLTRSPTEVHSLLAEARARWAPTERRFVVERGNAAVALADPERLGTALDALIENAVKQTEPGDEIRLGARREGGRVAIRVADSGPGIAPEQLEAIFERFARLDVGRSRERGGVGLGLAIVRAIAEAHGGSVRVRSALGQGSVFEILLPASWARLEVARGPGCSPPGPSTRRWSPGWDAPARCTCAGCGGRGVPTATSPTVRSASWSGWRCSRSRCCRRSTPTRTRGFRSTWSSTCCSPWSPRRCSCWGRRSRCCCAPLPRRSGGAGCCRCCAAGRCGCSPPQW